MCVYRIEHIQLAMPKGGEMKARLFYSEILGISETSKPPHLAKRSELGSDLEDGICLARKSLVSNLILLTNKTMRHTEQPDFN